MLKSKNSRGQGDDVTGGPTFIPPLRGGSHSAAGTFSQLWALAHRGTSLAAAPPPSKELQREPCVPSAAKALQAGLVLSTSATKSSQGLLAGTPARASVLPLAPPLSESVRLHQLSLRFRHVEERTAGLARFAVDQTRRNEVR